MRKKSAFCLVFTALLFCGQAFAASYTIDPDHTSVSFKIRHLFSNVQGQFTQFEGTFQLDLDKPETASASGTIKTDSINTNVKERDNHLRSADFFDVAKYPTIDFKTTKITEATKEHAKAEGLLTIHGVEKPVVMDVDIHGAGKDPWGNVRAAFTATTKINRKDFGLTWNQALETGQLLVGEEVTITIEAEGILKQ